MYVFPSGMFGRQIIRLHTLYLTHTHTVSRTQVFCSRFCHTALKNFFPKLRDRIDKDSAEWTCWYCTQQSKLSQLLNVGTQYSPSFPPSILSSFFSFVGTQYYGETGHSEFKVLTTVKYTSHVLLSC